MEISEFQELENGASTDKYKIAIDRYKFGYLSSSDFFKPKYHTHAVYRRLDIDKGINKKLCATFVTIVLISILILTLGCIEQFIVFFGALIFSTIASSVLFKR